MKTFCKLDNKFKRKKNAQNSKTLSLIKLEINPIARLHNLGKKQATGSKQSAKNKTFFIRKKAKKSQGSFKNRQRVILEKIERILTSPKAREGMRNQSSMTEELIEILNEKKCFQSRSNQTENFVRVHGNQTLKKRQNVCEKSTQILEDELGVLDLDPVVRVLVNRTLEQARMEVLEEEELAVIKREKVQYNEVYLSLHNQIQQIKIQDNRLESEIKRRGDQQELSIFNKFQSIKKFLCRSASKFCVKKLYNQKFDKLKKLKVFDFCKRGRAIGARFLESVTATVHDKMVVENEVKYVLEKIIGDVRKSHVKLHEESLAKHTRKMLLKRTRDENKQDRKPPGFQNSTQNLQDTFDGDVEHSGLAAQFLRAKPNLEGVVFGDSLSVFTLYFRNLKTKIVEKKRMSKGIKIKSKSKIKSTKNNTQLQNPDKMGKAWVPNKKRVHFRGHLLPSLLDPAGPGGEAGPGEVQRVHPRAGRGLLEVRGGGQQFRSHLRDFGPEHGAAAGAELGELDHQLEGLAEVEVAEDQEPQA